MSTPHSPSPEQLAIRMAVAHLSCVFAMHRQTLLEDESPTSICTSLIGCIGKLHAALPEEMRPTSIDQCMEILMQEIDAKSSR